MIKTAIIVTKYLNKTPNIKGDYIGVENGINYLLSQNIPIVKAMCDLDSVVDIEDRQKIIAMPNFIYKKDQIISDSEYAIKWALINGYQKIHLLTGGNRLDMDMHTFNLVVKYNISSIINDQHLIVNLRYGINKISPLTENAFFNIFAFDKTVINISGARYNVKSYEVSKYDTRLVSNEFVNKEPIIIEVLDENAKLILTTSPRDDK